MQALLGQAVLGAYFGVTFAVMAVVIDTGLRARIVTAPNPDFAFTLLLLCASALFAAGMSATGFAFHRIEARRGRADRRP